jgi:hypothetical protein
MLGLGEGAELRRPLGIAIFGGLVVSQLLTIFTTPVVYLAFDRLAPNQTKRTGDAEEKDAEKAADNDIKRERNARRRKPPTDSGPKPQAAE